MFLCQKRCFSEKLLQRPMDNMQKYEDDTQTTYHHHITREFFPKMEKNPRGQNSKKNWG